MKFTQLECVTREDYLAAVAEKIEAHHTVSKSGGRRGGARVVARQYGVMPQHLANVVNGSHKAPHKMLEQDGLEAVTVYVRKSKERQ